MKREEVLSLLKELMVACESMQNSPVVSLVVSPNPDRWKLSVKWVNYSEKNCFEKIIKERGLVASETADGYTIFHNP
jgi:hypothetical protein